MKNSALVFTAIAGIFSVGSFAQNSNRFAANAKMGNAQLMEDYASNDLAIVSYHVEERINMPLGGSVTTYNVSSLDLVNTTDLGQNNTRIITPKYGRAKVKTIAAANIEQPEIPVAITAPALTPIKMEVPVLEPRPKFVKIDIINTYERVLEKGYQSIDMLKRVANSRYFEGDLTTAAKWYGQLFELTKELESEYYFRYAQSLNAINQTEKANEMMAVFESKK